MDIPVPLTESFFNELISTELILARNVLPSTKYDRLAKIRFLEDGSYSGDMVGKWEILKGNLFVYDQWKKPLFTFYGAEARNGSSFLVGESFLEAQKLGFLRAVLYPYKPLGNFRICISSHVDYIKETIPRLLRSLTRVAFPKEDILVVVAGSKESSRAIIDGISYVYIKENHDGLSALAAVSSMFGDYWLLLHDTTEVNDDFISKMRIIDVGLNFDFISFFGEIGLYSDEFIDLLNSRGFFNKKVSKDGICSLCGLWDDLGEVSKSRHAQTKDVYGIGNKRDVIYLDTFGLKKYRRVSGVVAKP
jgi:hypothetical protein